MKMIEGSDLKTNRFLQSCLQKVMSVLYPQNCCMKGLDEPLPASLPNRMLVSCDKRGENESERTVSIAFSAVSVQSRVACSGGEKAASVGVTGSRREDVAEGAGEVGLSNGSRSSGDRGGEGHEGSSEDSLGEHVCGV